MKNAVRSWMLAGMLLSGCVHTPIRPNSETPHYEVKCGGECLELKQRTRAHRDALLQRIESLCKEGRRTSAHVLIEAHVETLLDHVRRRDAKTMPSATELEVARTLDCVIQHPPGDGLETLLIGKGRNAARVEYALREAAQLGKEDQWAQALDLLDRNQSTIAAYPYHAIQARLLQAEAHRHLGQKDAAAHAWQTAAHGAATLAARCCIPNLLERVAGQRPVSAPWPVEVARTLAAVHPQPLMADVPVEVLVWSSIGQGRIRASEGAEALSAFRRAASHNRSETWADFLSLQQAKALLMMEQSPTATSMLTVLVGKESSPFRASALALLGAGKLHDGHTQQAVALLREAVGPSHSDLFWRAEAEANLGLALLVSGDDANGLRYLHSAQDRFHARGDLSSLVESLENELRYHESTGRSARAEDVRRRLQSAVSTGVTPKGATSTGHQRNQ